MVQGNGCLNLGFLGYLGAATFSWKAFSDTSELSQGGFGEAMIQGNGCFNLGFLGYLGAATLSWKAFSDTSRANDPRWGRGKVE